MNKRELLHQINANIDLSQAISAHTPLKIGLMGPWGTGNLGDAAIQEAMIAHIKKYCPGVKIVGFSLCPEDTEQRHQIPTLSMCGFCSDPITNSAWLKGDEKNALNRIIFNLYANIYSIPDRYRVVRKLLKLLPRTLLEILAWHQSYRSLKGFDLLIVSGGGQLDDYFGGWRGQPVTLWLWGLFTRIQKVKYLFVSVGAGPLDSWLSRLLTKWALMLASYRSYRDEDSRTYLANVTRFHNLDSIYPDLAYSLDIEKYKHLSESRPSLRLVVGIGLIPYLPAESSKALNPKSLSYQDYLTKIALFCSWLIEQQCVIRLITGEARGDREVIQDFRTILAQLYSTNIDQQIIEDPIYTTEDLLFQLSRTDLVITSRYHGVLLSHCLAKPVLALSYHQKINVLMTEVGQAEYCLPIYKFNLETLKERFTSLKANREKVKEQLQQKIQQYREALDEQYEYLFGEGANF